MKYKILTRYFGAPRVVCARSGAEAAEKFLRQVDRSRRGPKLFCKPLAEVVPFDLGMLNAVVVDPGTSMVVAAVHNNQIECPATPALIDKMRGGTYGQCWYLTNVVDGAPRFDRNLVVCTRLENKNLRKLCASVEFFMLRNQQHNVILEVELQLFNDALTRPEMLSELLSAVPATVGVKFQTVKSELDLCRLSLSMPPGPGSTLFQELQGLHEIFNRFSRCRYNSRGIDVRLIGRINPWSQEVEDLKAGYTSGGWSATREPLISEEN